VGLTIVTLGVLIAATTAVAAEAATPAHDTRPIVATADGLVRGSTTSTTATFLGLPYAAPPAGALRWHAPEPAARWHGVRDATQLAPHCAQNASPFGQASTSEDCLYTCTPRPTRTAACRSWCGFTRALVTGQSDDYNPGQLVGDGAIVVTINYRLGALGFLAHPALANGPSGSSGDYGLMDHQAALRWVHATSARSAATPAT
jgi:para-nitrobenzyl esterase